MRYSQVLVAEGVFCSGLFALIALKKRKIAITSTGMNRGSPPLKYKRKTSLPLALLSALLLPFVLWGCDSTIGETFTPSFGDLDDEPSDDAALERTEDEGEETAEASEAEETFEAEESETADTPADGDFDLDWDEAESLEPDWEYEEDTAEAFDYDALDYHGGIDEVPIPDHGVAESVVIVEGDMPVWDIEAHFVIVHDFLPDLSVQVISPEGTVAKLIDPGEPASSARLEKVVRISEFRGERTLGQWRLVVNDLKEGHTGSIFYFRLRFIENPNQGESDTDTPEGEFPKAIPDNDPDGVSDTRAIETEAQAVGGVCVDVTVSHPFGDDLQYDLTAPNGAWAIIKNAGEGQEDGALFGQTRYLTGEFAGIEPNGEWTLTIRDLYDGDKGDWISWEIDVDCYHATDGDIDDIELDEDEAFEDVEPIEDEESFDDEAFEEGEGESTEEGEEAFEAEIEEYPVEAACESAIDIEALPFEIESTTHDRPDSLTPPSTCLNPAMLGRERAWKIELEAGESITAIIEDATFDPALYIIKDCADLDALCAGVDETAIAQAELLSFTAEEAGVHYIVVDSVTPSENGRFTLKVDEGLPPEAGRVYESGETFPIVIPDNDEAGIFVSTEVEEYFISDRICMEMDITHPMPSDLVVSLQSPSGNVHVIHNHQNAADGRLSGVFAIDALVNQWAHGEWRLLVKDTAAYNVGQLNGWLIDFDCGEADGDATEYELDPDSDTTCPMDEYVNGNWSHEWAVPLSPPVSVRGLFVCGGIDDWYKFPIEQGQTIDIDVLFRDNDGDVDLRLFREGNYDSTVASAGSTSDNEHITYTASSTSFYYLRVFVFGWNESAQVPYQLQATVE